MDKKTIIDVWAPFGVFLSLRHSLVPMLMVLCVAHPAWAESQPGAAQMSEVWNGLDRQTRSVIVERSQYVYRFNEDVLIDAYELLHWRDELDAHLQRASLQERDSKNGITRVRTTGYEWSYRIDDKMRAYFEVELYPVIYWCNGVLVNELTGVPTRVPPELDDAVRPYVDAGHISPIQAWAKRELPLIVAIDPLTQTSDRDRVYKSESVGDRVKLSILKGFVSGAHHQLRKLPLRDGPTLMYTAAPFQSYLVHSRSLSAGGVPSRNPNSFALVPRVTHAVPSRGSAFKKAPQTSEEIVYDLVSLKRMKLTPKELAFAWINGELEIPYRELRRVDGQWVCEEHLLERP